MVQITKRISVVAIMAVSTFAFSQGDSKLGIKVSVSRFESNEMRRIFGDGDFGIGVSLSSMKLKNQWKFTSDADLVLADRGGNKLFLVPLTVGFGRTFGDLQMDKTVPYAAIRGGGSYADYSITRPTTLERFSTKRFIPTANTEVGIVFNRNLRLSARYDWYAETDGFNFNGVKLSAAYHVLKF